MTKGDVSPYSARAKAADVSNTMLGTPLELRRIGIIPPGRKAESTPFAPVAPLVRFSPTGLLYRRRTGSARG